MFSFLYSIFGFLFRILYQFINNYGLALLIFTLFFRVILLPTNIHQQRALQRLSDFSRDSRESEKSIRTIRPPKETRKFRKKPTNYISARAITP